MRNSLGDIFSSSWTQKKKHAKRPIWSTIWSTKSRTRKDQSGAWFGAQKVAREKTHLEHDLEHKKSHAKRPIWSTIWSTKSCTRKDPSGARFGARKAAREKTHLEHDLGHKKLHAKRIHLEHDLKHKKLHAKRPIWSTIWSTKSCTRKDPFGTRKLPWMGCGFWSIKGLSRLALHKLTTFQKGCYFFFLLASLKLKLPRKKHDL